MGNRLSLALSTAALLVALLGATPLGEAARNQVPAFARNADKVDGIHAARKPKAGYLLPLGKSKKFPKSVLPAGPAGPQGPQGLKGDKGDKGDTGAQGAPGVSGLELVTKESAYTSSTFKTVTAVCPSGKKVVGGGAGTAVEGGGGSVALRNSYPAPGLTSWSATALETTIFAANWSVTAYAICATVTP